MARNVSKVGLKTLLKWWVDMLRMGDWKLVVKTEFVPEWPKAEGWSEPYRHAREATIWVDPRAKDQESVLVHELVHIKHSPIIKDKVASLLDEPVVWAISDALLALKRKAYGEEPVSSGSRKRTQNRKQKKVGQPQEASGS